MKANYKNWVPKGMILAFFGVALLLFILAAAAGRFAPPGMLRALLLLLLITGGLIFFGLGIWSRMMYRAFDYNGTRQMARQIIEGTASYVKLPEGGSCLDVGCGSGALGIAVAKRNPGPGSSALTAGAGNMLPLVKRSAKGMPRQRASVISVFERAMRCIWIFRMRALTRLPAIMYITISRPVTGRRSSWKHSEP